MKKTYILILVTAKDKNQAKVLAKVLLEQKLIACANIIDGLTSLFWWEGKIDQSKEALLLIKTSAAMFKKVEAQIKKTHSYSTPEIIAFPIIKGSQDYLSWIGKSLC